MSDVFISYSRQDRPIAQGLADDLSAKYKVWWDVEVYAGDAFHDVITEALDASTAVVVIWSQTAARSIWVRAEAMRALRKKKLVTTHLPDFNPDHLPLPFDMYNNVSIHNRDAIYRAIERLISSRERPDSYKVYLGDMFDDHIHPLDRRTTVDLSQFRDFIQNLRATTSPNHPISGDVNNIVLLTSPDAALEEHNQSQLERHIESLTRIHSALMMPAQRATAEQVIAKLLDAQAHLAVRRAA